MRIGHHLLPGSRSELHATGVFFRCMLVSALWLAATASAEELIDPDCLLETEQELSMEFETPRQRP